MKNLKPFVGPVVILAVLAVGAGGLRYLVWKQTHKQELVDTNPLLERQAQEKKATKKPGRTVVIKTNKGTMKFVLYEKDTPKTCAHFVKLIKEKFYDGSVFHRVEPNFVIQGGKPKDPKRHASNVKLELVDGLKHVKGAVGMARADNPDSATSEFYITLTPQHDLDSRYAVFGLVTEGMDVAKKIVVGDVMKTVRLAPTPKEAKSLARSKPK